RTRERNMDSLLGVGLLLAGRTVADRPHIAVGVREGPAFPGARASIVRGLSAMRFISCDLTATWPWRIRRPARRPSRPISTRGRFLFREMPRNCADRWTGVGE